MKDTLANNPVCNVGREDEATERFILSGRGLNHNETFLAGSVPGNHRKPEKTIQRNNGFARAGAASRPALTTK